MWTSLVVCTSFNGPRTATGRSARITIVLENPTDTEQDHEIAVIWGGNNRSQFSGTLQTADSNVEMIATTGTAPESATFVIGSANSGQSGT
jgi:hypothetical protein